MDRSTHCKQEQTKSRQKRMVARFWRCSSPARPGSRASIQKGRAGHLASTGRARARVPPSVFRLVRPPGYNRLTQEPPASTEPDEPPPAPSTARTHIGTSRTPDSFSLLVLAVFPARPLARPSVRQLVPWRLGVPFPQIPGSVSETFI